MGSLYGALPGIGIILLFVYFTYVYTTEIIKYIYIDCKANDAVVTVKDGLK